MLDNYPPGYNGELDDFLDPPEELPEFDDTEEYRENTGYYDREERKIADEIPLYDKE